MFDGPGGGVAVHESQTENLSIDSLQVIDKADRIPRIPPP